MKFASKSLVLLSCVAASTSAFQPSQLNRSPSTISKTTLNIVKDEKESALDRVEQLYDEKQARKDDKFDKLVKKTFPGALSNDELEASVVAILAGKGFSGSNTLLATSLCADELARRLEDDFVKVYGNNFSLGGLSGFPFAGNTGFGAMAAHIPDDGNCLAIYGPHVGIAKDGTVGKVEREGIALVDNCCGSAIAASNYVKGMTDGGATVTTDIQSFTDFQQGVVQELILPHGKRLADAENRMIELPYAIYDSQDLLMQSIVKTGAGGTKNAFALLGGVQINTSPDTLDYFHPLRFDLMNKEGEVVEDLLPLLKKATDGSTKDKKGFWDKITSKL